jgi:MFS transporter, DHA3 family, tetracycline resistance protein
VSRCRAPRTVYLSIRGTSALAFILFFTIAPLYRLRTAGLDPLQLVLVGSAMEAAVFLFEVPTGVVADVVSRRLSVIVGHAGMGVAFLLEAAVPTFAGVLIAQVLWGIAYTFTSGATIAWVSGELDDDREEQLASLFLRASRTGSAVALVALPVAWAMAGMSLRLPMLVGGLVELGLASWLIVAMGERMMPTRPGARATWQQMGVTARRGFGAIRASRVLVLVSLAIFLAGGASEAYDRLWQAQLLGPVGFPAGTSPLVWFGVVTTLSAGLGVLLPPLIERARPTATHAGLTRWLVGLSALQIIGLVMFGLSGSLLVAGVATLVLDRARSVRTDLMAAWLLPLTPPAERATALSTLEQCDSVGQVAIGPLFGGIARLISVPAALITSAFVLVPGLGVLVAARRTAREHAEAGRAPYARGS